MAKMFEQRITSLWKYPTRLLMEVAKISYNASFFLCERFVRDFLLHRFPWELQAGKDRTGIIAALVLSASGASDLEIVDDYARCALLFVQALEWNAALYDVILCFWGSVLGQLMIASKSAISCNKSCDGSVIMAKQHIHNS